MEVTITTETIKAHGRTEVTNMMEGVMKTTFTIRTRAEQRITMETVTTHLITI